MCNKDLLLWLPILLMKVPAQSLSLALYKRRTETKSFHSQSKNVKAIQEWAGLSHWQHLIRFVFSSDNQPASTHIGVSETPDRTRDRTLGPDDYWIVMSERSLGVSSLN